MIASHSCTSGRPHKKLTRWAAATPWNPPVVQWGCSVLTKLGCCLLSHLQAQQKILTLQASRHEASPTEVARLSERLSNATQELRLLRVEASSVAQELAGERAEKQVRGLSGLLDEWGWVVGALGLVLPTEQRHHGVA